jgi:predicted ATPase
MSLIDDLEIRGLRGIRAGALSGFAPLTVLVGPNSCGKSTVLEALLLAVEPVPADAARHIVRHRWAARRSDAETYTRWLFFDRAQPIEASVGGSDAKRVVRLTERDEKLVAGVVGASHAEVDWTVKAAGRTPFIEPTVQRVLLETQWSEVVRAGQREAVESALRHFIPNFDRLELLVETASAELNVALHNTVPGAFPVRVLGDGLQALLREALAVSPHKNMLILADEPEAFKHPRALRETAKIYVRALTQGNQIVLATHSLELIDMLLAEIEQQQVGPIDRTLAVMRLGLTNGVLRSSVLRGDEAQTLRNAIDEDLR